MADWLQPTIDSLKVDVLDILKLRDIDSITLAENPTSPPVGAKRWNYAAKMFQEWDGAAWVNLVISMAGGGTGSGGDNGAFGTMAYQNSDNVNITGGTIAEAAIRNDNLLARVNDIETIGAHWIHNAEIHVNSNLRIMPDATSAGLSRISFSDAPNSGLPAYIQAYEGGVSSQYFIISNNYYSPDGGQSARRNTAIGGSFLRLGPVTCALVGINTDGTHLPYIAGQPGYVTAAQSNFQVGSGTGTVQLQLLSNNLSYLQFMTNGTPTGTIGHGGGATYYDSNTHTWRSSNGSVSYASIDGAGTFAAYTIQSNSGNYRGANGVANLYMSNAYNSYNADVHVFSGPSGPTTFLDMRAGKTIVYGPTLCIGGDVGTGIRILGQLGYLTFYSNDARFYGLDGTTSLLHISSTGRLIPTGGIDLPNGSSTAPSLSITGIPGTGAYFNATNMTLEYGTRMHDAYRSCMRCYYNAVGGTVDFLIGGNVQLTIGPWPSIREAGHFAPASATAYYCGEPTLYWYQCHSYHGYVTISDIRSKDKHSLIGDDILDLIDSVEPFIASSKAEDYDDEHKLIPKEEFFRKFPTLSAQDIREKIDEPLGIQTVFGTDEHRLGIEYGRLTPLLWQAIRRLHRRLKELEN